MIMETDNDLVTANSTLMFDKDGSYMMMELPIAAPAPLHHGGDDGLRPTKTMRGAAAARKALGLGSVSKECSSADGAPGEDSNCGYNPMVFDRGSCSRSATNCVSYSKDVSSQSAREEDVAGVGTDSRFREDHEDGESAADGRQSRARITSARMAAEDQQVSFSSEMRVPKEEHTTIDESEEAAGVNESSLAKLKRKIRLKLLAEEARTTQLLAVKAEEELYNNNISNGRPEKRVADDGPSSSRLRPVKINPSPVQLRNHEPHHPQQLSQRICDQPLRNNGSLVRTEGRIMVDLSSDDEPADVSNLSRFQQQNYCQKTAQAPGGGAVALLPKAEEEAYSAVLERVLRPLLARAAAALAADQSTTRPRKMNRSIAGLPRNKSRKPSSRRSNLCVEIPLPGGSDSLDVSRGQNSVSRPGRKREGDSSNNTMLEERRKRGRPRKAETAPREPKSAAAKGTRPAKNKGELIISETTAAVLNPYERERELNILRNKAFLEGLNLSTCLEPRKLKEQAPKPHDSRVLAVAAPVHKDQDLEQNLDVIHNDDLHADHHVESQRSQITCALSGSSSEMQRSERTPTSSDDVDYEPEEQLEENEDNEDYNSTKSSRPPSTQSKGKSLKKGKEKACRGRPRQGKKTSIPKMKLARIIADLLTSKSAGALPPKLLEQLANSSIDDGDQKGTSHKGRSIGRSAAAKKSSTEPVRQQKEKRKAERAPPEQKPGSPTSTTPSAGSTGKKQRTATWLSTIPFETPKTEYEILRDEALQRKKEMMEKMGVVSGLIDELRARPREKRPYHKRWTSEPNPVFTRQTRLKDRLNSKCETEVKLEIVEVNDDDPEEKPAQPSSFGISSVAKFANWAPLQKQRPATTNSLEWDLNEPLMSAGERVVSFEAREGQEQLVDPLLTRIYSMNVGVIRGQYTGLLAAGGSQGRVAVFALRDSEAWSRHGREKMEAFSDNDDNEAKPPLLAWTIDSSWISQVIFLPTQFKEKEMLLLSSSNDGRVVLWDVNSVRIQSGTRELSHEGMPRVVCQTTTLHSGSIFGMHEMDGRMATASEDGVGISVIRETMIFMEKYTTGHHSGVIRNIRFRDKNILADCGADMVVGILDLRMSEPCTLKLPTAHKTAMNVVEWSPGSDNVLLSASLDPQIYLHDIRSPRKFSHALEGHVHPRRQKCYSVYRPTFIDGGHTVISPGEGTHQLALYAVDTGSCLGKVRLGHDTTTVVWSGHVPSSEGGLWAGSSRITPCRPVWGLPNGSSQHQDGQYDDNQERQPSSPYSDGGTSMATDPPTENFEELL